MPTTFEHSEEVMGVAEELMATIPMHKFLNTARIAYLTRKSDSSWKSKGNLVLAQISKPSPVDNFLSGYDLIVAVDDFAWKSASHAQRQAILDHELSHCAMGENGLTLIGHDLEEFIGVVRRHGLWREEIEKIVHAAEEHDYDQQTRLPFTNHEAPPKDMSGTISSSDHPALAAAVAEGMAALGYNAQAGPSQLEQAQQPDNVA